MKTRNGTFSIFLLILILSACTTNATPTSYPNEVNWETAVRIIHSGQVETVFQLHSLDVTLTMKDGSEVHTVEPFIDAVFQEVDKCGKPCEDIILITE
jgi:FlaG/FlaF family flagellin (archaellin)